MLTVIVFCLVALPPHYFLQMSSASTVCRIDVCIASSVFNGLPLSSCNKPHH